MAHDNKQQRRYEDGLVLLWLSVHYRCVPDSGSKGGSSRSRIGHSGSPAGTTWDTQ